MPSPSAIAERGEKIYSEKYREAYEERYDGKFLATGQTPLLGMEFLRRFNLRLIVDPVAGIVELTPVTPPPPPTDATAQSVTPDVAAGDPATT